MVLINQRSVWSSPQSLSTSSRNWDQFCSWITSLNNRIYIRWIFFAYSFYAFPTFFVYGCYLLFFCLTVLKCSGSSPDNASDPDLEESSGSSPDNQSDPDLEEYKKALEALKHDALSDFAIHVAKKIIHSLFIIRKYRSNSKSCYKTKRQIKEWLLKPHVLSFWNLYDLQLFVAERSKRSS